MKYLAPPEIRTQRGNIKYLEELRNLSRNNRNNPTEAEYIIWRTILNSRKLQQKFLRQKPIGKYILDFYCPKLLLAIEIDGDSHDKKYWQDKNRDWYMEIRGIKTIRFTNDQVVNKIDNVFTELLKVIKEREKEIVFSPFSRENARNRFSGRGKRV
ncbi:MAG TPA: endonuclease domain-containing protein [Candidatus Woesebacteria bacterium]|nr:endonuclease domain-containing protein [Candidatus Woesebacteria bacterium]HOY61035.1 endonuclease domain-containing protein [Candidatus Woesebacteria bacterium]HPR99747.1 endonuclease domain-containing protein [Candidatus Woesebacteria bacterium]